MKRLFIILISLTILNPVYADRIRLSSSGGSTSLSADTDYYLSSTGSDVTGDGTTGNPFATAQHIIDILPKNLGGHTVTILYKDGAYTLSAKTDIEYFINGSISIASESGDKSLVTLNGGLGLFYIFNCNAYISINDLSFRATADAITIIDINYSKNVDVGGCSFGDNAKVNTVGIKVNASVPVRIYDCSDIDTDKVAYAMWLINTSLVGVDTTVSFGDTLYYTVDDQALIVDENNLLYTSGLDAGAGDITTTGDVFCDRLNLTWRNITINRDGDGLVSSIVEAAGKTYTITRDGDGLVSTLTDGTYTWTITRVSGLASAIARTP
ncbi:MAG: hypothetical protein ABIH71_00390 [Candidatus Omnitrophota bacterium]